MTQPYAVPHDHPAAFAAAIADAHDLAERGELKLEGFLRWAAINGEASRWHLGRGARP